MSEEVEVTETELEPIIKIENADIFQEGNLILTDVSLTINKGEFTYLIGKTGSGKSSLLKTLYADIPLKRGKVKVAGYELNGIEKNDIPFLRRNLGVIFQDFQLLTDRDVRDNLVFVLKAIGYGDKEKINNRVREVLTRVGMKTKGFKMPFQLSGGEQQRVAIARALLNDPYLIIADEPTGNLDPNTSKEIMDLLVEISKNGRAILMATHDYSLIRQYPARMLRCDLSRIYDIEEEAL
ncbi:MAG: ATP-binding cassette domain-containing protein [Ichthyobacteriaceae bacterium]|nr:ATP-binding cassette domain-containing protein [Ichthyobacteriaceae bacterium]